MLEKKKRLAELAQRVEECRRCPLGDARVSREHPGKSVFSSGNPLAEVLFVGEGPGKWENRQGEAFVGDAGEQLDSWLTKVGWTRRDVYITNIVKCHCTDSKGNDREPNKVETQACQPWLLETIYIVDPTVIVCLGKTAALMLGGFRSFNEATKDTFDVHLRGRKYDLVYPAIAIPHPAGVLRQGNSFDLVLETLDQLKLLKRTLEVYRPLSRDLPAECVTGPESP